MEYLQYIFLALFLLSAPVAMYCVFVLEKDRYATAIANSYGFSSGMVALYFYPFLWPISYNKLNFSCRLHTATMNWIIWLSVFTELVFQIPHNLIVKTLYENRGTLIEWPFYAYGLMDSRWSNYHEGEGLDQDVWLINLNDACLGIMVLLGLLYYYRQKKASTSRSSPSATIMLVLIVVFRDATLWRETVEYMWDHHRKGYPFTTTDPLYRQHAINTLWLVNIIWLVAPVLSLVWGYNMILSVTNNADKKSD